MSLELARQVDRENPQLLQTNLGATCYQYTLKLIEKLRAAGHEAYSICKTRGEGQYTPPGFQPRTVTGLDGNPYVCTGVSHDAIWCDGQQFDTAARANDEDEPIFENDEKRQRGERLTALPVWNAIPSQHWRPRNPPLKDDAPAPQPRPDPPPPPKPVLPSRDEMVSAGAWLDGYYRAPEGLRRAEGLSRNGAPDWDGVGSWLFDVYLRARVDGKTLEQARAAVVAAIRQTDEWRSKHPGETP